jgi:sarcosine oxidase, subunit delta
LLLIPCPHCGERDETEFRYGGEAQPEAASSSGETLSVEAWGERLFLRNNSAGLIKESWFHLHGCQRWIELKRDTRTDEFMCALGGEKS